MEGKVHLAYLVLTAYLDLQEHRYAVSAKGMVTWLLHSRMSVMYCNVNVNVNVDL